MADPAWQRLSIAVAAPLIAGAIFGLYGGVWGIYSKIGEVNARQAVIQSQLTDARAAIQGVYTRAEAKRDLDAIWATDKDQYSLIKDLAGRMSQVEAEESHGRHH